MDVAALLETAFLCFDLAGCGLKVVGKTGKMLATAFKGLSVTSSSSLLGGRPCQAGTIHRPLPLQRSPVCPSIEAAHKKGAGSSKNGRYGGRARKVSANSLTLFCYNA